MVPAAADAQTTTPTEPNPPSTTPVEPDPGTTPGVAGTPTTVVGGGKTSIANVTFTLDLGATSLAGDAIAGNAARGTIRFDQDVQGPGRSLSGLIAQVRCVSVAGKQATVTGQVTQGTGAFHNAESITLFIEDNGEPVLGRPVDRFGSTVSNGPLPPTCPLAGPATPVDPGASMTEGDFVLGPQPAPLPSTTSTPEPSPAPTTAPSEGGAVSGP